MAQVFSHAGITAARVAGESPEMDRVAGEIVALSEALAAPHVKTGQYMALFAVERVRGRGGVTDREAYNDDPEALFIEVGHQARPSRTRLGPARWVSGLRIMTRAAAQVR